MKKKTTLFSLLVYTLKSNYLMFTYLFVPMLIKNYGNTAYLASLGAFLIVLLLVLLLPKKLGDIDYNRILNKSFIAKMSYYLLQFISLITTIVLVSHTINRMFFNEVGIYLFILLTVLVILFVSCSSIEVIFNSSTLLFIFSIILIFVPFFLTNEVKDYTLLKPFEIKKDFSFILLLYFGLDAITIIFSGVKLKKKLSKKKLIIPIAIFFLFMSIELLNIILVTGHTFMTDNEFLGFFSLFIQDTINYIGNLGVLYLLIIPVIGSFKGGYALRKIKDGFKISNKIVSNVLIFIILFTISFFIIKYFKVEAFVYLSLIISLVLLSILYLFILLNRSDRYEIRF